MVLGHSRAAGAALNRDILRLRDIVRLMNQLLSPAPAKSVILEIRSSLSPNRRLPLHFEGKALSGGMSRQVHRYLAIYAFAFSALLLVCALHAPNFTVAFSAVAATFNNIGPGLDIVGPTGNYAMLHPL